jgi:peptide chain release factor
MSIKEEKRKILKERMIKLNILEKDIEEKFILSSGKGGQKVQKTHNCVYIKHIPSQIAVKCQKDRLRENNRYFARKELCDKYEECILNQKTKKQILVKKKAKQKKRRQKKSKQKHLNQNDEKE